MTAKLFELYIFTRFAINDSANPENATPVFQHSWFRESKAPESGQVLLLARTLDDVINTVSSNETGSAGGVRAMSTEHYKLHSFSTLSGYRFLLLTDPRMDTSKGQSLLRAIYEHVFVVTVAKDPMYTPYAPITNEAFKVKLESIISTSQQLPVP